MKVKVIAAIVMMAFSCTGLAADWPQWQGPNRDGKSPDTGLLKAWPEDGPPLAWRVGDLGGGDSAPAIADGKIFLMSNRDDKQVVLALSEKDGREIWVTPLGPAVEQRASQSKEGPAGTPTVDGDRLYVEGMGGKVVCLQVKDGKIMWQVSMTEAFGGRAPMWSYRESPLVDGDKLICTPGGPDAILVALDKLTGEILWKSKVPEAPSGESNAGAASPGARPDSSRGVSGGVSRRTGGGSASASTSAAAIAGTKDPALFTSEHWGMSAFACKLPNGKYLAKLYFAETYNGITGPGQRVFSFTVQGREFKDFDVWAKTGGARRAYIEEVPVDVANGECRVVFTRKVENPAIKAIEIVPQAGEASTTTVRVNAGSRQPFTDSKKQVWQADTGFEGGMTNPGTMSMPGGFGGRSNAGGRRGGFGSRGAGAAYSSVIAIDFEGQRQYVQLISNALAGFSASDGAFLWRYDKPSNRMGINCSTPLHHEGHVFAASAYGAGGGLVKLSKDPDGGIKAEEVYATSDMENHHGGMILVDGYLYGANGGNSGGALVCLDFKTGKVMWDQREAAGRRAKGSLALADGRLYYRMEDGTMLLIEPTPKQYTEHGRFEQPDRRRPPAWAHPVIANGKLYVRDQDILFCYNVKAK